MQSFSESLLPASLHPEILGKAQPRCSVRAASHYGGTQLSPLILPYSKLPSQTTLPSELPGKFIWKFLEFHLSVL